MKLNRVLLTSVAVITMAGAANAADLIVDVPVSEPVAVADTGWYLSVFGGGVWDSYITAEDTDGDDDGDDVELESGTGWTLGVAVGAHVFDNIRGELELAHSSREITGASEGVDELDVDGSVTTTTLMGNLWVDLDTGSGFTPYIGGGLGLGYVTAESDGGGVVDPLDVDGYGLAYQVGAGVKFDVADSVALDLGYRFKGVSAEISGEGSDDTTAHVGSHVLQVGVTVGF